MNNFVRKVLPPTLCTVHMYCMYCIAADLDVIRSFCDSEHVSACVCDCEYVYW